ncbi:MAG: trigger factor [Anaerolineales bacterium]
MKIEQNYLDDHQLELTVETEQDVFEKAKHQAAKELARGKKIPGYRPGKAPYQLIVNHFGEAAIIDHALEHFLDDIYPQVIDEIDDEPYGPGQVKEIKSLEPPILVLNIPLQPEVKLGDYRAIRLDYEESEVADQEIEDILERMRSQQSKVAPVDHPAQEGNLVDTSLDCRPVDSAPEDEEAYLLRSQPLPVMIKSESDDDSKEWPFPGFSRQLLGVSAGDTLELTHEFADDESVDEDYRGKEVLYTVSVSGIRERVLPELNDEFVKSVSDQDTVEDLRQAIREELIEQHAAEDENAYISRILDAILEEAEIKYPPQMLENEIEGEIKELESQLNAQGLDMEMYLKIQNQDEDQLREQIKPNAEQRIVRGLAIGKISDDEELDISPEDITGEFQEILNNHFGDDQKGREEYLRTGESVALLNRISSQIITRKTLDFLVSLAKGEDISVHLKADVDDQEEEGVEPEASEENTESEPVPESDLNATIEEQEPEANQH